MRISTVFLLMMATNLLAEPFTTVYIGTYTSRGSRGIYRYSLDLDVGRLVALGVTEGVVNPSYLALHPNGSFIYSVSEVETVDGMKTGGVSAFEIDPADGSLLPLNAQPSGGAGPCHLCVDANGKSVLVANYGGGSVAALPIDEEGKLHPRTAFVQHEGKSVNAQRQEKPHAHSINTSPDNQFAVAADLGTDELVTYAFSAKAGSLTKSSVAKMPPGSGPRHFTFHPNGKFAYTNGELTSTVITCAYDAKTGELKPIQTVSTLPKPVEGNTTAEVQVHPNGKFLYCSNRGHDSIAIFSIDARTGHLVALGHTSTEGKTPRNFGIDPTGKFLIAANQDSDSIVVFKVDASTGRLTPTGEKSTVSMPVCVKFKN